MLGAKLRSAELLVEDLAPALLAGFENAGESGEPDRRLHPTDLNRILPVGAKSVPEIVGKRITAS
jgi:hypothetical protein